MTEVSLKQWIDSLYEKDPKLETEVLGRVAELRGAIRTYKPLSEAELLQVLQTSRGFIEANPELKKFVEERFGPNWAEESFTNRH